MLYTKVKWKLWKICTKGSVAHKRRKHDQEKSRAPSILFSIEYNMSFDTKSSCHDLSWQIMTDYDRSLQIMTDYYRILQIMTDYDR